MRKNVFTIPGSTLLLVTVILLNVPIFKEVIVFAYLSFVPGFVILKTFKLKGLSLLSTFLMSVGLSIVASMFVGLLVNQLYLVLGLSQPLSFIPLTVAMSTFTLIVFSIGYKNDFSVDFVSLVAMVKTSRNYLLLTSVLVTLPILSIVGALYHYAPIMIILYLAITVLCVLSIVSDKLIPSKSYPFLIFSISISILLLNLLMSKYTLGDDANLEYLVFKVTQIRSYWGPINSVTNSWVTLNYNSMLSVTLLPNVYSVLMNLSGELLFKILYSFIFSLVPVTLYGIYKEETGKLIGLLSTFFFVFSFYAFFGELVSLNRQIIAEFFLMLSILLWLNKTLPIREKRILLIIFGISITVSHYALSAIYLIFISIIVLLSGTKFKFDETFNASTILAIFGVTFLWYAFGSFSTLNLIINVIQNAIAGLTSFHFEAGAGNVAQVTNIPQVFTAATWINLLSSGIVNLLVAIGILAVTLLSGRMNISAKYRLIIIFAAIIVAVSFLFPNVAATLNFTRFYAIALLFLSPCFTLGALSVLKTIQSTLRKRKKDSNNGAYLNKHGKKALFLVAFLLGAYFLSQSGFVNYVTGGAIHSQTFDYTRMRTSSDPQVEVQFYEAYIQEQGVFSATWLSKYANVSSIVYSDRVSNSHVLLSEGLIPWNLILPLTNTTKPEQGSFVYLDSLNVINGIIPAFTGLFNTSEISAALNKADSIYSNGNSEIWYVAGSS